MIVLFGVIKKNTVFEFYYERIDTMGNNRRTERKYNTKLRVRRGRSTRRAGFQSIFYIIFPPLQFDAGAVPSRMKLRLGFL